VGGGRPHGQLLDAWGMPADTWTHRWLRRQFLRDQSHGLSCASAGICTWHTAPVQLARCRPCAPTTAGTASLTTGRCRPTDGSEQVDDPSRSANLSTIRAGCRGTARVRAVPTALPAWLILPDCACLPARALVAQMGILLRWVCYGPEPRSASLGLPFDCIFSPHGNTVTWPSGHVPAADRPGLRNAADSPGLPDYCCRRG